MSVESALSMKWSLVCSAPAGTDNEQIKDFSSWFVSKVSSVGAGIGIFYRFAAQPSSVHHCPVGDLDACTTAYEKIHKEHPEVLLVVHILPCTDSDEYRWMKSLSLRFGVIRQGVLLENALTRFQGLDHHGVCANVAQWISRRACQLSFSKERCERPFELRVGGGAEPVSQSRASIPPHALIQAVNTALHGDDEHHSQSRLECTVRVSGLPAGCNEFAVARLFGDLSVQSVSLSSPTEALVSLANKFHAFQAVQKVDGSQLDRHHKLTCAAESSEVSHKIHALKTANA